jgi:dihydrofolate reductase
MVYPIVLGSGKRLFGELDDTKSFQLVESRRVGDDGVVVLTYQPKPAR